MARNLPAFCVPTIKALIEVAKPRKPGFDLPLEDSMFDSLDGFYRYFPFYLKIGFPLGLMLLEFGTFIFMGRLKRFSRMPIEERELYVRSWVESRLPLRRDLIKGVKAICVASFYSNREALLHIGYDLDDHLNKVNGIGGPPQPAYQEAYEYFRGLEERGLWGVYDHYGDYKPRINQEVLREKPARPAVKKPSRVTAKKPSKPAAKKKATGSTAARKTRGAKK